MNSIGEKIKTLRKEKKLTQKELANKIDIAPSTITKYENNQLEPNLEILKKICIIFNISLSDLFNETNSNDKINFLYDLSNEKFNSTDISCDTIDKLTEYLILTVINKSQLDINIENINDTDKKLMFKVASSTIETFIRHLISTNINQ